MKNLTQKEALHLMNHNGFKITNSEMLNLDIETLTAIWIHLLGAMQKAVAVPVGVTKHKMNEIAGCTNDFWITHYHCPTCGFMQSQKRERVNERLKDGKLVLDTISKWDYCQNCGQHLGWGEENGNDEA